MVFKNLKLTNFRNYKTTDINFHPGTNVLFGKNGQGKTNILESIYYLALTKSFRSSTDSNLILTNEDFFRIQGELLTHQGRKKVNSIAYSFDQGKRLVQNGQQVQKFAEYIGEIPVVLLAPSDLQITQGGPNLRRRFLDIMLSQASQLYLYHSLQYRRSQQQRNAILQNRVVNENLLHSWENALIQNGKILIRKRLEAAEILNNVVQENYEILSGGKDRVKIIYRSTIPFKNPDDIELAFQRSLEENRSKDLELGVTTIGPHRDDLLFLIKGKPLRVVGSQGEHKTFVIALKMAEFQYLKRFQDNSPILLFDDIFGELDEDRITNMINSLSDERQVFITTTSPIFFGKAQNWTAQTSFYEIKSGTIHQREIV